MVTMIVINGQKRITGIYVPLFTGGLNFYNEIGIVQTFSGLITNTSVKLYRNGTIVAQGNVSYGS